MYENYYHQPDKSLWKGRIDPGEHSLRLHQVMEFLNLKDLGSEVTHVAHPNTVALLGFCCDEGVSRNKGRSGAKEGPIALRSALANLPVHFAEQQRFCVDVGNIVYKEEKELNQDPLRQTQMALSEAVQLLLKTGHRPIVLGGGHEIAFGHGHGIYHFLKEHHPQKKLGIINIDAHFDLRPSEQERGSSGTPFLELANLMGRDAFNYLCLGIQDEANTQSLFHTAHELGVRYLKNEDCLDSSRVAQVIDEFCEGVDVVYLTVCLDAFDAAFAPGVSAPGILGLLPHHAFPWIEQLLMSPKLISLDIAELSPIHDQDLRTAKLAARIAYKGIHTSHNND